MTDRNVEPELDLSRETLLKACKGNIAKLPSFMVHDDDQWPWHLKVRPAKGKIHMRRSTFLNVVVPQIPTRPGLWIRPTVQQFFIDLQAHHLEGPTDQPLEGKNHDTARVVTLADYKGALPDEEEYEGAETLERLERRKVERDDLERVARDPERQSHRSGVFSGVRDTEPVAMGDDD